MKPVRSVFIHCLFFVTPTFFTYGQSISSLKFLGECNVPFNKPFQNTKIGGLSGIDYDAGNDIYYLICDDRSAINAARFYTAKIFLTGEGIDSVQFIGVQSLLQPNGTEYPNFKEDPAHTPDPESIRFNPKTSKLVWTNEGERTQHEGNFIWQDPAITTISLGGKYEGVYELAPNMTKREHESGPRKNGTLEGVTFAKSYEILFTSLEEPLYEDGPRADVIENNALVRLYKYDVTTGKNVAQYGYRLEPIAYQANPPDEFRVNGISEILAIDENKLLVMERSFSTGRLACTVKVFLIDIAKASNVMGVNSLKGKGEVRLAEKKLLLNMDTLGIYIDNVEGISFGPQLPNGHRTLLFVTDNNFSALEKTQFFLFEVIP